MSSVKTHPQGNMFFTRWGYIWYKKWIYYDKENIVFIDNGKENIIIHYFIKFWE